MNKLEQLTPERGKDLSDVALQVASRLKRASLAPVWIAVIVAAGDLILFAQAFWFVSYGTSPVATFDPLAATGLAICAAALTVAILAVQGGYRLPALQSVWKSFPRAAVSWAIPGGFVVVYAHEGGDAAQIAVAGMTAVGLMILPARFLLTRALVWAVETGLTERRAVIVGGGENAECLIRGLAQRKGNDIRICGIFDDRSADRSPDQILDVPKIGRFGDLLGFARRAEIDLIIIALPLTAETRIAQLLEKFRVLPVPVHLSSFSKDFEFRDRTRREFYLVTVLPPSFRPERRLAKRSFDLVFGGLAVLTFAPIMALVAIAVRIDSPGPVLFRQLRHGFNDGAIEVLKFRTMYHNQSDPSARDIVTRGDPRVTRVGRILRKTSLDELPQLFNVLSGKLSLVGPRPHAVNAQSSRHEQFNQIVEGYSARHRLPPGITGWAQIHGWRGEIDDPDKLRERFAHDLFYIENWSLWLDLLILMRTPLCLLDTRRAY